MKMFLAAMLILSTTPLQDTDNVNGRGGYGSSSTGIENIEYNLDFLEGYRAGLSGEEARDKEPEDYYRGYEYGRCHREGMGGCAVPPLQPYPEGRD